MQKVYNPNRILTPMKRTNPKKGRDEDPGFVPISWDEALDTVAARLRDIRARGLLDENGYPRIAASFGGGGTPTQYMGTFPAFLAALGPVDMGLGSGQGVKCTHSEHLYGEFWHRAFTVCPDTPYTKYVVSFGSNVEASSGVVGVWRHANARVRGMKRVQIEPHLSVTGALSDEWVPIKPKTDPAFMFAMIHVLLHETAREKLDLAFLRDHTSSPYLVGPHGYYLRDPQSRKPLLWDEATGRAVAFDAPGTRPALEGSFTVAGAVEVGADDEFWRYDSVEGETAFSKLAAHIAAYSPDWAARICDVKAETIRRVAQEFVAHAQVGATIEIEGHTLPLRPVAVILGKTVNNGWGGFECCWARTLLSCLVGSLENPGGTLGTTVRLNRPAGDRLLSVKPGEDGFMGYPMNPTEKGAWVSRPNIRNAYRSLVPLAANSPWSPALGPTHLGWLFMSEPPANLPKATLPELWFVYRTNPAISFWDTPKISATMARFPFVVCFAYTRDETNHMADILLPDCTDLEGLQLIRIGGTKYIEQFWEHQGFALRQPVAPGRGESRDFTDIATELARRAGVLEAYNTSINRGAAGVGLKGPNWDFSLDPVRPHDREEIWDAVCKAASAELTEGEETHGLDWFREHGFRVGPFPQLHWYLAPELKRQGLRFELPYQERLLRIGRQLANRMHEHGINWWETQLGEYQALPAWKDFPQLWEQSVTDAGRDPAEFPYWLLTSRSMQYSWGNNVSIQLMREVSKNVRGHGGVVMNTGRARELGIDEGDLIEIESPLRATKGRVILRQGIRPDTLLILGQFDHWATPYAKDFAIPNMNTLVPISLSLTDATGSGSDLVRVKIRKLGAAA